MDPFTQVRVFPSGPHACAVKDCVIYTAIWCFFQKILDRAAQRSRQLGISDTSKFPVTEFPTPTTAAAEATPVAAVPKDQKNVVRFSSKKKPLTEDNNQQYDNISVEINITTDTNVGVSHNAFLPDCPFWVFPFKQL